MVFGCFVQMVLLPPQFVALALESLPSVMEIEHQSFFLKFQIVCLSLENLCTFHVCVQQLLTPEALSWEALSCFTVPADWQWHKVATCTFGKCMHVPRETPSKSALFFLIWHRYHKIAKICFRITAHGELFASLVRYPHHLACFFGLSCKRQFFSFSMFMEGRLGRPVYRTLTSIPGGKSHALCMR